MVRFNKKLVKVAATSSIIACLLMVGHYLAVSHSTRYNAQLDQVSNLLSEYVNNHLSTAIEDSLNLKFTGSLPRAEMSKKEIVDWNMDLFQNYIDQPITEPKVDNLVRAPPDPKNYKRANATLVVLVRNKELSSIRSTIVQIESKFNNKFHYPYVFLNDDKFSRKFIKAMKALLPYREIYFEEIDQETWNKPATIDKKREREGLEYLKKEKIGYATTGSYHNMCRFYSGNFYNHPRLQQFRYYWRFEPSTNYFCDIDYDLFKFMEDNNKTYGFTIALYDAHQSVKSLWTTTLEFLKQYPQYVHPNGAFNFLTENLMNPEKAALTQGYSTCHFWSNFEIGDMDFYRGEAYSKWFKHLDESGGFYYERWGDAPVHSIGLSLFEDKSKLHWFRDIGYEHMPYVQCPNSPKCATIKKGEKKDKTKTQCQLGKFTFPHLYDQNCMPNWINYEMDDAAIQMY